MAGRNDLAGRSTTNPVARVIRGGMRRLALRTFGLWPRLGVWVLPKRYDDPVPDGAGTDPRRHQEPAELVGIDLDLPGALERLGRFTADHRSEWEAFRDEPGPTAWEYFHHNPSYGRGDAEILWAFLRSQRPARVIEVGSGISTRVIAAALRQNAADGSPCRYEVVDPFPGDVVAAGIPGLDQVHVALGQDKPVSFYAGLAAGDVLFIDSSHMLKAGSDCEHLFLEVIPNLAPGVLVHVHDVYLPYDYPSGTYQQRWYWNEQYVLRALLIGNRSLEVLWPAFAVFRSHFDELAAAIPRLGRAPEGGPCSFWMRVRDRAIARDRVTA